MKTKNLLLVGVGGQGVLLASSIISLAAQNSGNDVKMSEVHGMAQRGGVVSTHVRYGEKVYSPLIAVGDADIILAFEAAEALRWSHHLKPEGVLYASPYKLVPPIVSSGRKYSYPENPLNQVRLKVKHMVEVDAFAIAMKLGNPRLANTAMVGALSLHSGIELEHWENAIRKLAPKNTAEPNLLAFHEGRKVAESGA
ncbi:indolepyruvate oxidoreductase subunit beta [bacterium]|nr:indolepyruvate oxidoreductase subunit beta [FCB group bacterium]MBL7191605.1 indolepyruvate oxidoreductase subunit beta [bacterium]